MKKRILPLLAALALLAGCTGQTSPSGTPAPTPAPAVSSAPAPTPAASGAPGDQGLVWGENFGMEDIDVDSLPTQTAAAPDLWTERLSLVGAVPEADISLYLLNLARPGVLLRQGGEFSYFPLERQFQDLPLLVWRDFDGDGGEELAVRYLMALDPLSEKYGLDGDVLWPRFELHIYGRDGASWSDASFGDAADLRAALSSNLSYTWDDHEFTLSAGQVDTPGGRAWLTSVSGWLPDTGVAVDGPLIVGRQIFFRFEDAGIKAVITLGLPAAMGGEATDLATLTATLEYRDGVLSLGVDFLLEAVGGV